MCGASTKSIPPPLTWSFVSFSPNPSNDSPPTMQPNYIQTKWIIILSAKNNLLTFTSITSSQAIINLMANCQATLRSVLTACNCINLDFDFNDSTVSISCNNAESTIDKSYNILLFAFQLGQKIHAYSAMPTGQKKSVPKLSKKRISLVIELIRHFIHHFHVKLHIEYNKPNRNQRQQHEWQCKPNVIENS